MTYGPDTALVQGVQESSHINDVRGYLQAALQRGDSLSGGFDAYYDAGGFRQDDGSLNPNALADGVTLAFPDLASDSAAATAALGSYHMQAFASNIDPTTRTATVSFLGRNEMTLGSAMASAGGLREAANQLAPTSGALAPVRMDFGWTETIHY
jgi:hypothetical protein